MMMDDDDDDDDKEPKSFSTLEEFRNSADFRHLHLQCQITMLKKLLFGKTKSAGTTPFHMACIHKRKECCWAIINGISSISSSSSASFSATQEDESFPEKAAYVSLEINSIYIIFLLPCFYNDGLFGTFMIKFRRKKLLRQVLCEPNKDNLSTLHMACSSKLVDIALYIIEELRTYSDAENQICLISEKKMHALPIHYACLRGLRPVVRKILEVASSIPSYGDTPVLMRVKRAAQKKK